MARARRKASDPQPAEVAAVSEAEELDGDELSDADEASEELLDGDGFEESSGDEEDEAPDLEEVLAEAAPNGLAVRREIERRLEEKRLAKDLDDLDFDLD